VTTSSVSRRARNAWRRARGLAVLAVVLATVAGVSLYVLAAGRSSAVPTIPATVGITLTAIAIAVAVGLGAEFRRPRVADLDEASRAAKAPGLGVVRPEAEADQPFGRRATWFVPDDPWRLTLAALTPRATAGSWVLVSGEEAEETGQTAAGIARAAAAEPRSTLLIDTDPLTRGAVRDFPHAAREGVAEVVADGRSWQDVLASATGEYRALDLVGPGVPGRTRASRLSAADQGALRAMSRGYAMTIISLADPAALLASAGGPLPNTQAVLVAVRGVTPLAALQRRRAMLEAAGVQTVGVVVWEQPASRRLDEPRLSSRRPRAPG
jgi:Mrp family chromosome partitioning ATPase